MAVLSISIFVSLVGSAAGKCYRPDLGPEHKPEYLKSPHPHTYTTPEQVPSEFTWQNVNGKSWLSPMLNQHIPVYCGSCWLHGSISILNDRLKIARNGASPDIILARQVILNCGSHSKDEGTEKKSEVYAGNCKEGGSATGVFDYMMKIGMPDETCQQYDATDHECSNLRQCMNCDNNQSLKPGQPACYPVTRYEKYFVTEWGPVPDISVHNMKAEIFRRGPITCGVDSGRWEEGRYRRGEIIQDTVRPQDGKAWESDHFISVVGWGSKAGLEYWIVRNSWGRYWGEGGFVRVATGKNVMNIENDCSWAVVAAEPVEGIYGPSDSDRLFPSADPPDLTEDGYQEVLSSKFQKEDVATFIRRLNVSDDLGLDYDSAIILEVAAAPPATIDELVGALKAWEPAGVHHATPIIVVVGVVAGILATGLVIGGFVGFVGRRRLLGNNVREVPRAVPLAPAGQTEVA